VWDVNGHRDTFCDTLVLSQQIVTFESYSVQLMIEEI
jgi:hypothetical protein